MVAAAAVAAAAVVGGVASADAQRSAGNKAADAQRLSAQQGIDQQDKRFAQVQQILAPYVNAGNKAVDAQGNLIGLNGTDVQQKAIDDLQNGPQFTAMLKQGTDSILQNASATGGLRGGNTQNALAQFSPNLLAQLIQQQYDNLGGLTSIGQNAAAMTGNAGMQTGNAITNLLQQQGAASAGALLNEGKQTSNMWNSVNSGIGMYGGMGGFGSDYTKMFQGLMRNKAF